MNDLTHDVIKALCLALQDRELKTFHMSLAGSGLNKAGSMHLLEWLKYGIFVEDSLSLDLSLYYLDLTSETSSK